jgi:hypothetical protein
MVAQPCLRGRVTLLFIQAGLRAFLASLLVTVLKWMTVRLQAAAVTVAQHGAVTPSM